MSLRLSPADEETLLGTPLFAELGRATVLELISGTAWSTARANCCSTRATADRFFLVLEARRTVRADP
jgi:hypothetical protein